MQEEWPKHFFIKYIYIFLLNFKGVKFCRVRETYGQWETKTDCYIDPQLLPLTIAHCVIFKSPHSTSSVSRLEYSTGGPVWRRPSGCSQWLYWHWLTFPPTDPDWREHLHISYHNTHDLRSTTGLLPLINTSESYSETSLMDGSVNIYIYIRKSISYGQYFLKSYQEELLFTVSHF